MLKLVLGAQGAPPEGRPPFPMRQRLFGRGARQHAVFERASADTTAILGEDKGAAQPGRNLNIPCLLAEAHAAEETGGQVCDGASGTVARSRNRDLPALFLTL
jgi:hypothetical protein